MNRCLIEMKVCYSAREAAREKRGRSPSVSVSSAKDGDDHTSKKAKKAGQKVGISRLAKVSSAMALFACLVPA